jgi:hypothetical protein
VTDDGRVFVLAALGGSEQEVFLCLAYDGTECEYLKHYYVPVDWMAAKFPKIKDLCQQMLSDRGRRTLHQMPGSGCRPRSSPARDNSAPRLSNGHFDLTPCVCGNSI